VTYSAVLFPIIGGGKA